MLVLAVRAAMDPQQRRILCGPPRRAAVDQQAVDFRAVVALETNVFDGAKLQLSQKCIVVSGELAQPSVFERENLRQCRSSVLRQRA